MRITLEELYRRLVTAESRVTALERQLRIDLTTGLIAPSATGTLYVPFGQKGRVRLAVGSPFPVPFDCTFTQVRVELATASSSGSVTLRLTTDGTPRDTTLTASSTSTTSTWAVSLLAGDVIVPEVTLAGTAASGLGGWFKLVPA